jgi:aminoglycoside 6-adenylyltransferase
MEQVVREELLKMLTWYIGVKSQFLGNPGKFGKYFKEYLEPELWGILLDSYADSSYDDTWESLDTMGDLFRRTAVLVAAHFGFEYPHGDDERVSAHLKHVRLLPGDAREMY